MQKAKKEEKPLRLVFLNSHPIQYYAPLYQYMGKQKDIDLTVIYCSKHGLAGELDAGFGVPVKWDIPLLGGYNSIFFKNYSKRPNVEGMWGLINWGIISFLFKSPKSILVVYGWGYFTNLLALFFGKLFGHTICMRGDNPALHEKEKTEKSIRTRRFVLSNFYFRLIDYFLCVGKENKKYFKLYGASDDQLIFTPHAVDNHRFSNSYQALISQKNEIKSSLGIDCNKRTILYSGKYIEKKRPLDLLKAFHRSGLDGKANLVFMGEGHLRGSMEKYIQENNLKNVLLTGFVNQTKIANYYAASDVLVMCSQVGETWGLSVNEAMNFHLPVLLSDMTGCSADLLEEGRNGYLFKTGDVGTLSRLLRKIIEMSPTERAAMGKVSAKIVEKYSYQEIVQSLHHIWKKVKK